MISVLIPVFNRKNLLDATLRSLHQDNHTIPLQVIVVDDGSTDESVEYIEKSFPWVELIKQDNKGAPVARNLGLKHARYDYILYLDSDDLVMENFFKKKVDMLEAEPKAIGAYGPWDFFESNSMKIIPPFERYPILKKLGSKEHIKNTLRGWYIPCNAILWRREALLALKGQREDLVINQDVDLTFRALMSGKIIGVESAKALIRQHESNRVGVLDSEEKLRMVLNLRKEFASALGLPNKETNDYNQALGSYLFDLWVLYRKVYPRSANEALLFSKQLFPGLQLSGGVLLKLLGKVVGAEKAVIFKSFITSFIS